MARSDFLSRSRLFLEALKLESINKASRSFDMGAPQASRDIALLEKEVGTKLLKRFPTGVRPTEEGARFAEKIMPLIEKLDAMEASLRRGTSGEVLLGLPPSAGAELFPQWIAEFRTLHPENNIVTSIVSALDHPPAGAFSFRAVARRIPSEENLVAVRLFDIPLVNVASPEYLSASGDILDPSGFAAHRLLVSHAETALPLSLTEQNSGQIFNLDSRLTAADAGTLLAVRNRVRAGDGIGLAVPEYMVAQELARRELVEVLPSWKLEPEVMWFLRPQSRYPSLIGQQLVSWFRECAKKTPSLRA